MQLGEINSLFDIYMLDFPLIGNGAGRKIFWSYLENHTDFHLISDTAMEKSTIFG